MKRHKHFQPSKNYLWIAGIIIIILVIIGFFVFKGSSDEDMRDELEQGVDLEEQAGLNEEEITDEALFEQLLQDEKEEEIKEAKEESIEVSKGTIGEEGLCEDYFFEEGDTLKILKHEITVERVGRGGIRVLVDGNNYVLNDGDTEYVGDGIRLSIKPGDILYFGSEDEYNSVQMRVGCSYEDNPNEKYIQERGESVCRRLVEFCEASFDID